MFPHGNRRRNSRPHWTPSCQSLQPRPCNQRRPSQPKRTMWEHREVTLVHAPSIRTRSGSQTFRSLRSRNRRCPPCPAFQTQTFDVCFHCSGGLLVLEFESSHTPQTAASTQAAFRRQMLASIAAMQSAPNFQTCLRRCAREVHKVILLSALDGDVICFFRPEIVSTVGWGGRPTDSNGHE